MRMFKSDVVVKTLWFISEKRSETETASACLVNVMPWGNANKKNVMNISGVKKNTIHYN